MSRVRCRLATSEESGLRVRFRVRRQHGDRRNKATALAVLVLVLGLVLGAFTPVAGQERDIEGEGDAAKVRISDSANENRIDRAVIGMLIIAVSLALLTLLFWWHTQPTRRARVLAARTAPVDGPDPGELFEPVPPDDPLPEPTDASERVNEGVIGG